MWKKTVGLSMGLILVLAVRGSFAQAPGVEISAVNTAADLDLSGNVIYALNFGNNGNPRFGNFVFSQDQDYPGKVSLSCSAEEVVPSWYGVYPDTGDSNLDMLIGSGAWTNNGPGACTTSVSLSELEVGTAYRLQLLFYETHLGENRLYDITVGGETIVELYDVLGHQGGVVGKTASVLKYVFTADESLLHIAVTPVPNNGNYLSSISGLILTKLWTPSPDFNGDFKINIEDLVILIEHWGQNEPSFDLAPPPAGDGIIDRQDLEVLMSHWGEELPDTTFVAHWPFDETEGNIAHNLVGDTHATIVGLPLWQPDGGKVGGALQLGGPPNFATAKCVRNPSYGPLSVFAWVKGGAPGQVILSQASGANWLMAGAGTGVLTTELKEAGAAGKPLVSSAVITDDAWHRVGFVWDGSNRILYVDDIEVAKDTQAGLASSTADQYIGTGRILAPGSFWSGLIDDIRIYSRAVKP